jgi:hypothetical protein
MKILMKSVNIETNCEVSEDVVDSDYFDDNDGRDLSSIATVHTSLLEKTGKGIIKMIL